MSKKNQPQPPRPIAAAPAPATKINKTTAGNNEPKNGLSVVKKLCIFLAVITLALYANTLQNGYVLDDVIMVRDNTIVAKGIKGIGELLSTPHMRGYLIIPNDTYRPLSLVMFALETQFFGQNPVVNHFFNILVFAGCVILFFLFLNHFFEGKKPVAAFIGALLFALHPVHTEVVANIKSRDELLCFFFAFWSLIVFMKYMKEGKTAQLLAGSFILFLSIISKENTITFLGVVPLLFFFFKNENRRRSIMITAGTVVSIIAFIAIRAAVLKAYDANVSTDIEFIDNALVHAPNFASRIATAVLISGKYIQLLFVPYPLLCNYSFNAIPFATFANIGVLASLAGYGFIIYYAVTNLIKKNKDPFAFAIVFFLMTISLFTNLFILIGAEMGERFLFMASAGWCMAGAVAIDKWLIKSPVEDINWLKNPKILALLVPLTLVFGSMVFARNKDWKDNVNLYKVDLEKSPNDARLNYYLGTALAETVYPEEQDAQKKVEIDSESIVHLRNSLAIYAQFSEANAEMGRVFDREKRYDSAEIYDRKALAINPNHATATNNLGSVFLESGQYRKAADMFKKAIDLNFDPKLGYFNLARTYGQMRLFDSAIYCYKKTLEYNPNYIDAYMEMGMAYFSKGRYDSAEVNFKIVLNANPNLSPAINNLGAVYLNTKNYAAAIEQFKKSIALDANYISAYSNLGRAYYFNKQYDLAIQTFMKEMSMNNKSFQNIPYIALSYKAMGNMPEALKYEAIAKHYYSDFKL